jgi:hypothetical protein
VPIGALDASSAVVFLSARSERGRQQELSTVSGRVAMAYAVGSARRFEGLRSSQPVTSTACPMDSAVTALYGRVIDSPRRDRVESPE